MHSLIVTLILNTSSASIPPLPAYPMQQQQQLAFFPTNSGQPGGREGGATR